MIDQRKAFDRLNGQFMDRVMQNIGILRMTGEVTDRFNEITLCGMALFWQKAIEFRYQNYDSFSHIQSGTLI